MFDPLDSDCITIDPPRVKPPQGAIERGPGRPKRYLDGDGEIIKLSASGLADAMDDGAGLKHWYAQNGLGAYHRLREYADNGTAVHNAIDAHIHGDSWMGPSEILDASPQPDWAHHAFDAFLEWERTDGAHLSYVATEIPIVSCRLQIAGTIDLIARSGEGLVLIDFKTSRAIRRAHIAQLAVYDLLWEEARGERAAEVIALKLPREEPGPAAPLTWGGKQLEVARKSTLRLISALHGFNAVGDSLGVK